MISAARYKCENLTNQFWVKIHLTDFETFHLKPHISACWWCLKKSQQIKVTEKHPLETQTTVQTQHTNASDHFGIFQYGSNWWTDQLTDLQYLRWSHAAGFTVRFTNNIPTLTKTEGFSQESTSMWLCPAVIHCCKEYSKFHLEKWNHLYLFHSEQRLWKWLTNQPHSWSVYWFALFCFFLFFFVLRYFKAYRGNIKAVKSQGDSRCAILRIVEGMLKSSGERERRGEAVVIITTSWRGIEWQLWRGCHEGYLMGTGCSHMRWWEGWVGFCCACESTAVHAGGARGLSLKFAHWLELQLCSLDNASIRSAVREGRASPVHWIRSTVFLKILKGFKFKCLGFIKNVSLHVSAWVQTLIYSHHLFVFSVTFLSNLRFIMH